jgi:hypothetical protein
MKDTREKKSYLILLAANLDREQVVDYLSSLEGTGDWFFNLPNSFFIQSSLSAAELSNQIKEKFGKVRHFITEVHENRQGLLPKEHWTRFYRKEADSSTP